MLREERHREIINSLEKMSVVKVSELKDAFNVTEMTIRRDLSELEDLGLLTRIHGGAVPAQVNDKLNLELSHIEKKKINLREKQEIAQRIAQEITDGDIVFLGAGTTIELVVEYLDVQNVKIITNSYYIFDELRNDDRFEIILIGGTYRAKTGAFAGPLANDVLKNIYVRKAFIGVNAVDKTGAFNANEEEGITQQLILDNAEIRYLVADSNKFERRDFYRFYHLEAVDYLITDASLTSSSIESYSQVTALIYGGKR